MRDNDRLILVAARLRRAVLSGSVVSATPSCSSGLWALSTLVCRC